MFGTPRVPRGDSLPCWFVKAASCCVLASLSSCSGDAFAGAQSADAANEARYGGFENSVAHTQHVTPTPSWDGSIDGPKTLWYDSGVKRGEGRYVSGRREDAWTYWYENGQKRWEGTYHDDLVQGVERSWYANGAMCYEGTSVAGRRHGTFRAWYEDGHAWWKGEYRLGVREGDFQYWHRDGSPDLKVTGHYSEGKRVKALAPDGIALAAPK